MSSGSSSSQPASVTWVMDSTGLVRVSSTWLSWNEKRDKKATMRFWRMVTLRKKHHSFMELHTALKMCYFVVSGSKTTFSPLNKVHFICKQHMEYLKNVVNLYLKSKEWNNNSTTLHCTRPEEFLHLIRTKRFDWLWLFQTAVHLETSHQPVANNDQSVKLQYCAGPVLFSSKYLWTIHFCLVPDVAWEV